MSGKIKEITVFTQGDSTRISTWSNVPFLLTETLLKKGIRVNRVNIGTNRYMAILYNKIFVRILSLFFPLHNYTYRCTWLNYWLAKRKIRRAINAYPSTECNLFLTFGYIATGSPSPSVLLCDWSFEVLIRDRFLRQPYGFEQKYIDRENASIKQADLVISLFPKSAERIRYRSSNPLVCYLGGNVVNTVYEFNEMPSAVIKRKYMSEKLLFIGDKKYLKGAKVLLAAYQKLKEEIPGLELSYIGLTEADLGPLPEGVKAFGYLRKEIPVQQELYYKTLLESKLLVNPTQHWAGYSSTIEAMYYYTPVLISPYIDFVEEFGQEIPFGEYTTSEPNEVAKKIRFCFSLTEDDYTSRSKAAHEKVANYTWDAYVDKLLQKIESLSVPLKGIQTIL